MANSERPLSIIIRNNDGTSNNITLYSVDGKLPTTIEIGGIMKTTEVSVSETELTDDDSTTLVDGPEDDLEGQAVRFSTLRANACPRPITKFLHSQPRRPTGSEYTSPSNKF
jgi:hypothetical protein